MSSFVISIIDDDYNIEETKVPGATLGSTPEYPSQWFQNNPRSKPPVNIPRQIADPSTWERMLGHALEEKVSPNLAVRFIYEYSSEHLRERLETEWVSYGVRIGSAGEMISPISLLRVLEGGPNWTAGESDEIDPDHKMRLFSILLSGYRYGIASELLQGDYKSVVLGKINQVLRNEPFNLDSDITPTELSRSKSWYNNSEFKALIAAMDMFWAKFPDSPNAKLRVCTLNSRFKDCASISELKHLADVSSKRLNDAMKYIFSTRVRDEIRAIGHGDEELEKSDSYFPYMRELRLSKKSPYSSSENVHLHNWVSIFGALLGSDRSFNARIVSENGLLAAMNLAIFAAYAFRKYTSAKVVFGDTNDAEGARMLDGLGGTQASTDESGSKDQMKR